MNETLNDLAKSFILDEDRQQQDIEQSIKEIMKFCKIDKNGHVIIDGNVSKKLNLHNKVMLTLSARYLGSKLQEKTGQEVTIKGELSYKDLAEMLKEKPAVIAARLTELKDQKKVKSTSRGVFSIAAYSIPELLNNLKEGD